MSTLITTTAAATTPASAAASPPLPTGFVMTRFGEIGHNARTAEVLRGAGGVDGIIRVVARFYDKFHADAHLAQFLGGLQQPVDVHANRLGSYISEMMGAPGEPWLTDVRTNPNRKKPICLAGGRTAFAADRQSAHHCAWNSIDRPAQKVGRRFKLDDCRVWMRLFFWAVRESGHGEFSDLFRYLQKFVCYFIAIYESTARSFTLAESRWSADPANIAAYERNGRLMGDVVDVPLRIALESLPRNERDLDAWLYENAESDAADRFF